MLGFYNYTVYLTYVGLLSGVFGMYLAMAGRTKGAVICLLVCGLCDMFDGKIARTKKDRTDDEKRFGIQIDSLCDVVCFGVLPAVISFSLGCDTVWQIAVSCLFVLCGVIRLGYFNVTEETRQKSTSENRSMYAGLPITASAFLLPLLMCFSSLLGKYISIAFSVLLAVMALCYISPLRIKKPGKKAGIVLLVAGAVILIYIIAK